ncbi:MAG: AAA family ATPase [Candidatus Methylomirabilota bacterium]|jgi:hypothetical protein
MSAHTLAPHDDAAEVSVLGAVLQDPEAARTAAEMLHVSDFFRDDHRETFGVIKGLVARGISPDLVIVADRLTQRGRLQAVGGGSFLVSLVEAVPTAANIRRHAALVKRDANRRRLHDACVRSAERAFRNGEDLAEVAADLRRELDRIETPAEGDGPDLVSLADVTPEAVCWLWPRRIPCGKLSLIIGDPGHGKSCVTLDMAARVSRVLLWPDGGAVPPGGVVLLSAEDDLADTIRPRLDAMGADPSRVVALRGVKVPGEAVPAPFRLAEDLAHLETAIKSTSAVLVVVDPVSAYLGKADSYKDAEVRAVLAPLAALGERTGAAVVAVMHLTKDAQRKVLYRAQGSLAFVAASRAVFAVAEDQENPERRLFLPVKNNLGPKPPGLAFRLAAAGSAVRVEWDTDPVAVDADAALAGPEPPEERGEREEAKEFLTELLAARPVPSEDVKRQARAAGIAERTLFRAKRDLGVKADKEGFRGGWVWSLSPKAAKDATTACTGNAGNVGNLREAPGLVEVQL